MTLDTAAVSLCPTCHFAIDPLYYFCPNCGGKLKEKPPNTSFSSQALNYAIAIFLPPLGLWPAIKYLKTEDPKSRKIGIILIALTVVSTIVTTWYAVSLINQINTNINKQLNQYNSLGL